MGRILKDTVISRDRKPSGYHHFVSLLGLSLVLILIIFAIVLTLGGNSEQEGQGAVPSEGLNSSSVPSGRRKYGGIKVSLKRGRPSNSTRIPASDCVHCRGATHQSDANQPGPTLILHEIPPPDTYEPDHADEMLPLEPQETADMDEKPTPPIKFAGDTSLYVLLLQSLYGLHGKPPLPLPSTNPLLPLTFCFPEYQRGTENRSPSLNTSRFVFPAVRDLECHDGQHTVYWCTCSPEQLNAREVFAKAPAEITAQWTREDVCALEAQCEHTRALQAWVSLTGHPAENRSTGPCIHQSHGCDVHPLLFHGNSDGARSWYLVQQHAPSQLFAVIDVCSGTVSTARCTSCFASKSCKHILAVSQFLGQDGDGPTQGEVDPDPHFEEVVATYIDPETGGLRVKSVSQNRISPISFTGSSSGLLRLASLVEPVQLKPIPKHDDKCTCGSPWSASATSYTEANLYDMGRFYKAHVHHYVCAGCGEKLHYDGGDKGVLNLNNHDLFSHTLLRWYSIQMATAACPFHAHWRTAVLMHISTLSTIITPAEVQYLLGKRAMFREAWVNYVALQDLPYADVLSCKCDTDKNEFIICDGIVLGTQKQQANQVVPWAIPIDNAEATGSLHKQRVFVASAPLRSKLRKFFTHVSNSDAGLSPMEYDTLCGELEASADVKPLRLYLAPQSRVTTARGDTKVFSAQPDGAYHFLRSLTSDSPVCSIIPMSVHSELNRILASPATGIRPAELKLLSENAPVLFNFVMHEYGTSGLSNGTCELLRCGLNKAKEAWQPVALSKYRKFAPRHGSASSAPGAGSPCQAAEMRPEEEFIRTGYFYPSLGVKRPLRRYAADRKSQRTGRTCNKFKNVTRGLVPGLFVAHCLKCSRCLGFHMMEHHESPRTLFQWLYTRFEVAPSVVVYDNNCHGHAYCLNREPQWASKTLFLIDKTHYKGHTGCSRGYDISCYPKLATLNSQLAEQKNAKLAKLKGHCAYMSQPMFLVYVRFFLYMTSILAC